MTKPPNYGGNPYERGTKSFRSRKPIQHLVVNNATTHKIAARHLLAALGARVGFLSNVVTAAVLQPVLTAAWKDTRLALGERSAPVAYQAQYLSAGIKPGPSEASSLAVSAIPSQLWLVKRGDNCRGICSPAKRRTIRSRVHLRPGFSIGAA